MPIDQWNYLPSVLYDKRVVVVVITTNVVSSYQPAHGEMYLIQHYVIKCVNDVRRVGIFLMVLRFHLPVKLTATIELKYC